LVNSIRNRDSFCCGGGVIIYWRCLCSELLVDVAYTLLGPAIKLYE